MSKLFDSGVNVTQLSNGVRSVSQTRLNTMSLNAINISCNGGRKFSMDSTCTSVKCESEYDENCSYVMIHSPGKTDKRFSFTSKMLNCRQVASFMFVLCTVILLYQAPVVLFYTTISPHIEDSDITDYVDFKTCSVKIDPTEEQTIEILLEECNNTLAGFGDDLDCDESAITGLSLVFAVGWYMENTECYHDSLSFFCNATLLLCNGNSSSVDLTEECEEVRDNKCASEWRIVESFFNTTVPDCMSYNEHGNMTFLKAPSLPCPSEFDHFCGSTCLPVCDGHYLLTENILDLAFYVLAIITATISLIGGVIALIACFCNQGRVLKFPQIYIVYNIVVGTIIVVIENIPVVVGKSLVCSDRNYWIAAIEPTNFCQAQGFVMQFSYGLFFGFWCFHLLHLYLCLAFPFKTKRLLDSSSHRRMFHIIEVTIVLLVSVIPPIITLTLSQYESNGYYCYPQSPIVLFYGEILPSMFKLCIGFVLLFLSLRVLRKENHRKSNNIGGIAISSCMGYSIPEVKLILIFCYYFINYLVYLTALVTYLYVLYDYGVNIFQYKFCSAGGYKEECEIYKERAEESFIPSTILSILSALLFSMISFSHMTYVVQFLELKKAIKDKLKSWHCI